VIFGNVPSYGDWSLAVIYTFVFAILAFLFYRPKTGRDWRAFGAFTAFLAALFIEMYVFPLTIYLLSVGPVPDFYTLNPSRTNSGGCSR